jgi:hypothetical protein
MLACPSCKRRSITRRDILRAPLDGTARCRACGHFSRLDLFSRWIISCLVAITVAAAHLSLGVFYSGHLLVISICLIFGAARGMAWMGLPFLSLEPVPPHVPLDRRQSLIMLGALLIAAVALDGFIASRFEKDEGHGAAQAPSAVHQVRTY